MCLETKATAKPARQRSTAPIDLTKTYRFRDGVVAKHLRRSESPGSAYPFAAEHQTHGTITFDKFGNYYAGGTLTDDWDLIPEPPAPVTFDFAKTYRYRNGQQPIDVFLRSRNPAMSYTNRNDLGDDSVFPVVSICPEGRSRSHTSEGRLHIGNHGTFSEWDLLEVVEPPAPPTPAKPDWLPLEVGKHTYVPSEIASISHVPATLNPEPQIPNPEPGTQVAWTRKEDSLPRPVNSGTVRLRDGADPSEWWVDPGFGTRAVHQKDIHEYWTLVPGSGIKKP